MEITMWLMSLHKPYSTIPAFCTTVSLIMPNDWCLAAGPLLRLCLTHPHTGRPPQPLDPHTRSAKTKTESGPPQAVIQSRFEITNLRGISNLTVTIDRWSTASSHHFRKWYYIPWPEDQIRHPTRHG